MSVVTLPAQLAYGQLALQHVDHAAELGRDRPSRGDPAARHVEGDDRGDEVQQVARIDDGLHGCPELVGQIGRRLHQPAEDVHHRAPQRVHLRRLRCLDRQLGGNLDPRDEIWLGPDQIQEPDPLEALDHQPDAAVGSPCELVDHPHGADFVEVRQRGRLRLRVPLGHERDQPVAAHHVIDQADRAGLSDGQRKGRQWEHDRVPQRQDRQRVRNGQVRRAGAGRGRHQRAVPRFGNVMQSRPRS